MLLHYAFDERAGATAADTSGRGLAGSLLEGTEWGEGVSGGAVLLNRKGGVAVPAMALAGVDRQISVAFWTKGSSKPLVKKATVFSADSADALGILRAQVPAAGGSVQWVAGAEKRRFDSLVKKAQKANYAGQWNHWVLVKNAETSEMAIYLNGQAWAKAIGHEFTLPTVSSFTIGTGLGGRQAYRGLLDDFRIYGRALSADEVNALFRGTGTSLLQRCGGMWVNNGCFDGGSMAGWHGNNSSFAAAAGLGGSDAAQLGTGTSRSGSIRQTIFGLAPNTGYRLSAWVASSNEADMTISAEGYGGRVVSPVQLATPTWQQIAVDFHVGAGRSSATVECAARPHVKLSKGRPAGNVFDSSVGFCDTIALELTDAENPAIAVAADDKAVLDSGDSVTVPVLANDSHTPDHPLKVKSFKQGAHGSVVLAEQGGEPVLVYSPAPGFTGNDTFSYAVVNKSKGVAAALVTVSVLPAVPAQLRVVEAQENQVSLAWNGHADRPAASYEIRRNGQPVGSSGGGSYVDGGVSAGQVYGYEVVAVDGSGNRSGVSDKLLVATPGVADVNAPSIAHGRALWIGNSCGSALCHQAAKDFAAGSDAASISEAILNDRYGMGQFSGLTAQDIADIAAYVQDAQNGGDTSEPSKIAGIARLNNEQTLRKAAILLAARLPTSDELAQAQTDYGLREAVRGLMQGPRFTEFVYDVGARQFLTAGAGNISADDFPALKALSQAADTAEFSAAIGDARREPLELLRYIVENDRPYSEILTADYTLVNPRLANAYQAQLLGSFPTGAQTEWVPARLPYVSARTPELAAKPYPHAGVLSTTAWLSRFPTTDTNRNRHRAKMVYRQFLGFDIETQGQRPLDDSQNDHYLVPTMENPNCVLCHRNMEPVAGAFQNWGSNGFHQSLYWDRAGMDSLASAYKSSSYYLDGNGKPWFSFGDKWYRDMFEPGLESKAMPGGSAGFGRVPFSDQLWPRAGWSVLQASTQAGSSLGAANVLDGNPATVWRSAGAFPQYVAIDMGVATRIAGIVYVPRGSLHVGEYDVLVSSDGLTWNSVHSGVFSAVSGDPKPMMFSAPVTARYVQLNVRSDVGGKGSVSVAEIYAVKPADNMHIPYAGNGNGTDDPLQWLAREITSDQRFAKGAVSFWYSGLFGRAALQAPANPAAPGYQAALAAYQVQERVVDEVAGVFVSGGFKVRDLLVELVMSDLFRARSTTEALTDARRGELAEIGQGRLLNAEELNAKSMATIGQKLFDSATSGLGLLYSGFDGGKATPKGNTDITTTMLAAAESRVFSRLCDKQIEKADLALPAEQRMLFPLARGTESPLPFTGDAPFGSRIEHVTWTNLAGSTIASLENSPKFTGEPDELDYPMAIDTGANGGDTYGERFRGYLVPPADGVYQFWVAGDDQVSLRIAVTPDEADLREIAYVSGYTGVRQWTKFPEQLSVPLALKAGQRYLLEVIHKEGAGGDHVSVSWSGPGFDQRILAAEDFAELNSVPGSVRNSTQTLIKRNLQYLHARLLGETLNLDDPEIERGLMLYHDVYLNQAANDSGMEIYCETRNGAGAGARAWNAVLAYLLLDFGYLNQ
jgi:hypothetical protein